MSNSQYIDYKSLVPSGEREIFCPNCGSIINLREVNGKNNFFCSKESNAQCKYIFKVFTDEKSRNNEFADTLSFKPKYKFNKGKAYFLAYEDYDREEVKRPSLNSIIDIVDSETIEILLKGFCEQLGQAIVFVHEESSNLQEPSNLQWPDSDFLKDYVCESCFEFMESGECRTVKKIEVSEFKKSQYLDNVSFYLCKNGNGGLHLQYPVFIDGKFLGLLISGTVKFEKECDFYELEDFVSFLNKNFDNNNYENEINEKFLKFNAKWYDNNQGIKVTYKLLYEKYKRFEYKAKKTIDLLVNANIGRYFGPEGKSVRLLLQCLLPEGSEIKPTFGDVAFKRNFKRAFDFIRNEVIPVDEIIFYENFFKPTSKKLLRLSLISSSSNDYPDEFMLTKEFDSYYEREFIYIWNPSDEFIKHKIQKKGNIKESNYPNEKSKVYYTIMNDIFKSKSDFIAFFPIKIDIDEEKRALIILSGSKDHFSYSSKSLRAYFMRLYDVFKVFLQIYSNQIFIGKLIQKTSHDLRFSFGDLYTDAGDTFDDFERLNNKIKSFFWNTEKFIFNFENYMSSFEKFTDKISYEEEKILSIKEKGIIDRINALSDLSVELSSLKSFNELKNGHNIFRRKLEDYKSESINLLGFSERLSNLAEPYYQKLTLFEMVKVDFYKDIHLPLFHKHKRRIKKKGLFIHHTDLNKMPSIYVIKEDFFGKVS